MDQDLGCSRCSVPHSASASAPDLRYLQKWQFAVPQPASEWPRPTRDVIRELIFKMISAYLSLGGRRTRCNLREAVQHRFGRPIIRPVYSIDRIRDKHPLVAMSLSIVESNYDGSGTYTWNSSVCKTKRRSRNLHADNMSGSSSEPSTGVWSIAWSNSRN